MIPTRGSDYVVYACALGCGWSTAILAGDLGPAFCAGCGVPAVPVVCASCGTALLPYNNGYGGLKVLPCCPACGDRYVEAPAEPKLRTRPVDPPISYAPGPLDVNFDIEHVAQMINAAFQRSQEKARVERQTTCQRCGRKRPLGTRCPVCYPAPSKEA